MFKPIKKLLLSWQFILLVGAIIVTILFACAYKNYNNYSFSTVRFQNVLQQKSFEAGNFVAKFKNYLVEGKEWKAVDTTLHIKPEGIDVLVYKNDSLYCWTSQVLPFNKEDISLLNQKVVKLSNTWYLVKHEAYRSWDVFSLVSVKTEYSFSNAFLNDKYAIYLPLVLCEEISIDENVEGKKIEDVDGSYLFTALKCDDLNPTYANWGILFLFLSVVLYVQLVILILRNQTSVLRNNLLFLTNVIIVGALYFIHIHAQFPAFLFYTPLFSPVYFGATDLFPNLGSLLLFSIIVLAQSFILYKYVTPPAIISELPKRKFSRNITIGIMVAVVFVFWHIQNRIVTLLVSNSVTSPILFKVSNLQFFDVVRMLIISLLWFSAILVMERVVVIIIQQIEKKILVLIVTVVCFTLALYSFSLIFWVSSLMFLIIVYMLIGITRRKSYHGYTTFIWFVGVFSLFAVYSFYFHNYNKEMEERSLLVENLSFRLLQEEDPLSEMLLKEMEDALISDSVVKSEVIKENVDINKLSKYLKADYFHGYLERYDLQVIPCWPGGDVYIDSDDITYNCYDYFTEMLDVRGVQVMGSKHFYFLSNQIDLITYFGVFKLFEGDVKKETSLFVELVAKPSFEGPGYPELLLTQRESKLKEPLANYSYAKYVDGQLKKQVGNFTYPIRLNRLVNNKKNFDFFNSQGFSHVCYFPQEDTCVVLSLPKVSISTILISFSMLFIAFFIFGSILIMLIRLKRGRLMFHFTVQERIQIAFVGLMMVLLVIVASGSVWQTIRRFEIKNNLVLSEKTKSILMELSHKIGNEEELTADMEEYLVFYLKKFSSIFYTDINLYGTNGRLIASSRPELFNKGLVGHLMNSEAFVEINCNEEVEFIHRESIGDLSYLSAYVPFLNHKNKVLAYLNMPYFVGTTELRDEISSLVMAIVNFYLIFLIVVIGLTVIVSRRITHPLKVVQAKIGKLRFGGRNEKIEYKGEDEIGQLVHEYNRMVDELSESADKLAKSEREMAWREMARQIAHEIKNPLTPMKLSIQYLERAKADGAADFDTKLKKVSSTLIDQIDKLSSIASEFSNFAKMPIAKRKKLDVIEVLLQCVSLFDKTKGVDVVVDKGDLESYFIYADSEQMISVFNNLLQNAIQSIPSKRIGQIEVRVKSILESITIEVKDNGQGISAEVQEKLFVPNFTTKSSGMGLGLAIVKNIVVSSGGKIWFETELRKGSSFFVRFSRYD